MLRIADIINSSIRNYKIDSSAIENVQTCVNETMKVDGWVSLVLSNSECVVLKYYNGVFLNEGYIMNTKKVLRVFEDPDAGSISCNPESIEEQIVDLDHGSRFEGSVLKESGVPFGFGQMYDDDGLLIYKGIMINWKRFGYGMSYHNNGTIEYDGYWCDDYPFGKGKVFDRRNKLISDCTWCYGKQSDKYDGDGETVYLTVKSLTLNSSCNWNVFDIYLLESLEHLDIKNDCCSSVKSFKVSGLPKLKTMMIGKNSFTLAKNYYKSSDYRTFEVSDCESLTSIEIREFCFSDCSGDFVLRNLPSLKSLIIGSTRSPSYNFYFFSFVAKGSYHVLLSIKIYLVFSPLV